MGVKEKVLLEVLATRAPWLALPRRTPLAKTLTVLPVSAVIVRVGVLLLVNAGRDAIDGASGAAVSTG